MKWSTIYQMDARFTCFQMTFFFASFRIRDVLRLRRAKSPGVFSQIFHFFELRLIGTFAYNHHATLTIFRKLAHFYEKVKFICEINKRS